MPILENNLSKDLVKNIFDKIKKDGYVGLSNYILDGCGKDEDESICWNCMKYIFSLLCIEYVCHEDGRPILSSGIKLEIDDLDKMDLWKNGLYFCYQLSKAEAHYFTIFIDGDDLTLIQTTQGIYELTVKIFDKRVWLQSYKDMAKGNTNAYKFIFSVPEFYIIDDEDYKLLKLKFVKFYL